MVNTRYYLIALEDAGLPVQSVDSDGAAHFKRDLTTEEQAQADVIRQEHEALAADPPVYQGEVVWTADDVDRITIRRIRDYVRPDTSDMELKASAEIRQLKNAVAANLAVTQYLLTYMAQQGMPVPPEIQGVVAALQAASSQNAEVDTLRAEGVAFKQSKGWM